MRVGQGDTDYGDRRRTRLLAVVGPTASGKSELALNVALRCRGEIISADSMQVYRGMDVGTAKPGPFDRLLVPHHLTDVVDPLEPFSVARFQQLASKAISEVSRRGHLPVVVGGTGLYVRALLFEYDFTPPGRDPAVRAELERRAQTEGTGALHGELAAVDPRAAARIHPRDRRRIARALEVYAVTGRPLSSTWLRRSDAGGRGSPLYDSLVVGLRLERSELYARIDRRVDRMIAGGLVEEVRGLVTRGYTPALISGQALGYKEVVAYLQGGASLEETVAKIKQATRNYAKRQMTWFRAQPGVVWLDVPPLAGKEPVDRVIELLASKWGLAQDTASLG